MGSALGVGYILELQQVVNAGDGPAAGSFESLPSLFQRGEAATKA